MRVKKKTVREAAVGLIANVALKGPLWGGRPFLREGAPISYQPRPEATPPPGRGPHRHRCPQRSALLLFLIPEPYILSPQWSVFPSTQSTSLSRSKGSYPVVSRLSLFRLHPQPVRRPWASWLSPRSVFGLGVQGSGFRFEGSGFRVQGSGFRVQGSGFRVQGSGCTVLPLLCKP